jgi:hypothetical protein
MPAATSAQADLEPPSFPLGRRKDAVRERRQVRKERRGLAEAREKPHPPWGRLNRRPDADRKTCRQTTGPVATKPNFSRVPTF